MSESVELHLRRSRTVPPPEALRDALMSQLSVRRRVHLQKVVLRASMAFLALTLFWAYGMESGTAKRMAVAMGVMPAPARESGMAARLLTPSPMLPLSPRTPEAGGWRMANAACILMEGDLPCVY